MRSAETESQSTIDLELRAAASEIAAPKRDRGANEKKYLEALFTRSLKRKIISAKIIRKSADKSLLQP